MSKITTFSFSAFLFLSSSSHAHASAILGKITSLFSGEIVSLLLSAALAIAAGFAGVMFTRIARTLRETGEFLAVLGSALDDKKISRDELASIVKETKDIFHAWI